MSYCTVDDLRAEGVSEEDYSDEQLGRLIEASSEFIDKVTGQWFELREQTIRLDGRGGRNLVLPVFLSEAHSVKVDHEEISDYVLYNRMEDRAYPKIFRCAGWPSGRLNVEVSGQWGYVEEGGSTPPAIKRAAMKLALYNFPALTDTDAIEENAVRGLLLSETTDGHTYMLSDSAVAEAYSGAITGDAEIDGILKGYMRSRFRMAIV
ncbi:MAG: hypothetical protein IJS39_17375 [Synergistaceae bacterium]|nr:hypothetical protein [Synergistaceae bacterium]